MNPDVAAAVPELERRAILTSAQAQLFGRVARRELVSLHAELRLVAYAGVLLVMAGVGELVRENLDRIGPTAIASALALAALVCFFWVARRAPAFTWEEVPSPHLALDYVLLLGALLTGADLAYLETKFTPLGSAWPWHLLIVSVFYLALAFRYDSRVLLSLSLSTFAAWRGVSAGFLHRAFWMATADVVRANAAACGVLFLVLGAILRAAKRKAHFEPVLTHLGWLLLLGAATSGLADSILFAFLLLLLSVATAVVGYVQRRFSLLAFAVVGSYVGVSALVVRLMHEARQEDLLVFWFALTPLGMIALLFLAHWLLREKA